MTESGEMLTRLVGGIDDRTLHELYAWPFAEGIRAGVGAVMMAYNAVSESESSGTKPIRRFRDY